MGPLLYIKLMNASSKAGGGGPIKPSGHTPPPPRHSKSTHDYNFNGIPIYSTCYLRIPCL